MTGEFILLPLREKVSAKLTDEGSTRLFLLACEQQASSAGAAPHPTAFARHLLPRGEKGVRL
jgi:hypothetical protein